MLYFVIHITGAVMVVVDYSSSGGTDMLNIHERFIKANVFLSPGFTRGLVGVGHMRFW